MCLEKNYLEKNQHSVETFSFNFFFVDKTNKRGSVYFEQESELFLIINSKAKAVNK